MGSNNLLLQEAAAGVTSPWCRVLLETDLKHKKHHQQPPPHGPKRCPAKACCHFAPLTAQSDKMHLQFCMPTLCVRCCRKCCATVTCDPLSLLLIEADMPASHNQHHTTVMYLLPVCHCSSPACFIKGRGLQSSCIITAAASILV